MIQNATLLCGPVQIIPVNKPLDKMLIHGFSIKSFTSLFNNVSCKHSTELKLLQSLTIYLNYHVMYTFFTYFLKIFHNRRKSLEEYFCSLFRCIYSIYIHSWAHTWLPFRKVFLLIVWKECLPELIHFLHTASRAAYPTLKKVIGFSTSNISRNISFSHPVLEPFQY